MILGCTHYPLISDLLQDELGPDVVLVSSAEETARDVAATLERADLGRAAADPPDHRFLTTGDAEAFAHLAEMFLGRPVARVERVDVGVRA